MGGYGGARMKVYMNQERVRVSGFKDYMSLYEGMETPVIFEQIGDRWEVCLLVGVLYVKKGMSVVEPFLAAVCVSGQPDTRPFVLFSIARSFDAAGENERVNDRKATPHLPLL